ncbi:F0F1 ATP synthase subunit delta [Paenibacillus sp. NPDC058071]|uniref:F0F1 ATP synthase subunit delta n=1 Tax=Paenibacillus sp. NPDC058071 TaxID=3346326 RepID=UPI0036DC251E
MSRDIVVAKRYAKALFDLAQQDGIVAEVEEQLKLIVQTLEADENFSKFLSFPSIDPAKKVAVLKEAYSDRVSSIVLNTLELLVARGRQDAIGSIYIAYTKIAGEALGQAHATIYSASQLTVSEFAEVVAQFSQISGKKIIAQQVVEPELLGGVQVRIGDRLYDGSLSGKLDRLQKAFKN